MFKFRILCADIKKGDCEAVIKCVKKFGLTHELYEKNEQKNLANGVIYPLHIAAMSGKVDIVDALISLGFRTDKFHKTFQINGKAYGCKAIHFACNEGHLDVVKCLIEKHDVDINSERVPNDAYNHRTYGCLIRCGSRGVNLSNILSGPPINCAIAAGHLDMVMYLVDRGASLEPETARRPALNTAVRAGELNILKYLLQQNPNVDCRDVLGNTPLHDASFFGDAGTVEELFDAGADLNVFNEEMITPLMLAGNSCKVDLMKLMISRGACLDDLNVTLYTLLQTYGIKPFKTLRYLAVDLNVLVNCSEKNGMVQTAFINTDRLVLAELLMKVDFRCCHGEVDWNRFPWIPDEFRRFYEHLESVPQTLQQLTCLAIRQVMDTRFHKDFKRLPLPNTLLELLDMKHIPHCEKDMQFVPK